MAKTWQVILATVAIFVAGLVTGGATAFGFVRWVVRHRQHEQNPEQRIPPPPTATQPGGQPGGFGYRGGNGPQQFGPQLMRKYANALDLTPDQHEKVGAIVKATVMQLSRQRREVQLTSALALEKMQDDIAALLTPEQRTKFEDLISAQRQKLQEFKLRSQQPAVPPAGPTADSK